jgi:hypothetical protein
LPATLLIATVRPCRPGGAYSMMNSCAPGISALTDRPCMIRQTSSSTGASTPTVA